MSADIFGCHNLGWSATGMQCTEGRDVLNVLLCTGPTLTTKSYPAPISIVLRMRNPVVKHVQNNICARLLTEALFVIPKETSMSTSISEWRIYKGILFICLLVKRHTHTYALRNNLPV